MTNEEALTILQDGVLSGSADTPQNNDAVEMAIYALEKQIAIKGITETDTDCPMYKCPICGKRMIGDRYAPKCYFNFCAYCGQAIDWSE